MARGDQQTKQTKSEESQSSVTVERGEQPAESRSNRSIRSTRSSSKQARRLDLLCMVDADPVAVDDGNKREEWGTSSRTSARRDQATRTCAQRQRQRTDKVSIEAGSADENGAVFVDFVITVVAEVHSAMYHQLSRDEGKEGHVCEIGGDYTIDNVKTEFVLNMNTAEFICTMSVSLQFVEQLHVESTSEMPQVDLELRHGVRKPNADLNVDQAATFRESFHRASCLSRGRRTRPCPESSGSGGVKAAEAIGLQGVPASYGDYTALV